MTDQTFEEAKAHRTAIEQFYEERISKDLTLARLVDWATAETLVQIRPYLNRDGDQREQYHIARAAAIQMMSMIYANDFAMKTLTAERDHFMKVAEQSLMMGGGTRVLFEDGQFKAKHVSAEELYKQPE